MVYGKIQFTPDGSGKCVATRVLEGAGPGGEDLHFELNGGIPDNAVGMLLVSVPYQDVPDDWEEIVGTDVAVGLLFLSNTTDQICKVSIRTKSDLPVMTDFPLAPGIYPVPLVGVKFSVGLEWKADAGVYGAFNGFVAA